MEQEPDSPILYNTVKRVGYNLALGAHAIFIGAAIAGAIFLLITLLASRY